MLGPLTSPVLRPLLALLLALLLAATLVPLGAGIADARPDRPNPFGSDPVVPGKIYRGDFPDPSITRARGTWWAYGTGIGAYGTRLNLPVLSSGGLRNWRPPAPFADAPDTDALPQVASWADWWRVEGRRVAITWAPSVARIKGRFVAAYSVRKRTRTGGSKVCISIATSRSPRGPFVDRSKRPLVCPGRRGAIDPDFYREKGRWWLLFKTDDNSIGKRAKIWIRRLNRKGTSFPKNSRPHRLLKAKADWEHLVVENPSMIRYKGKRYLFYSGNGWGSSKYAIGYAVCERLRQPCKRVIDGPLIDSDTDIELAAATDGGADADSGADPGTEADSGTDAGAGDEVAAGDVLTGPGGADAFKNRHHRLRLAYHAWDAGLHGYPPGQKPGVQPSCVQTVEGCGQRRLHIARLKVDKHGRLKVQDLGWRPRR